MSEPAVRVELTRQSRYRFDVSFDGNGHLVVDEVAPIGEGAGPSPSRLLATAVGHCLSASLIFCLDRARVELRSLVARVDVTMTRNDRGRLRIGRIAVRLVPGVSPEDRPRIARCLEVFEDYCVVTASLRGGIAVDVEVAGSDLPPDG
jgi:uncharacterized OsmC-like protein